MKNKLITVIFILFLQLCFFSCEWENPRDNIYYPPEPAIKYTYHLIAQWGSEGSGPGQFGNGMAVAVNRYDADSDVYVLDTKNNRVQVFDAEGNYLNQWGSAGSGEGQFKNPGGIAVDSNGALYIADTDNHRIQVFNPDGSFVRQWGGLGTGAGQFIYADSVAEYKKGLAPDDIEIYTADRNNSRIQVFDANGNFLRRWNKVETGDQFGNPYPAITLKVDSSGNAYVMDNTRIEIFDSSGVYSGKWGKDAYGDGAFSTLFDYPVFNGIAINNDYFFITDISNDKVMQFSIGETTYGNFLGDWGDYGIGDYNFNNPASVESAGNKVYIADKGNHRIQIFEFHQHLE